jgi:hypothetical protein
MKTTSYSPQLERNEITQVDMNSWGEPYWH